MGQGLPDWEHWMGLDLLPQLPAAGTQGIGFQLRHEQRRKNTHGCSTLLLHGGKAKIHAGLWP